MLLFWIPVNFEQLTELPHGGGKAIPVFIFLQTENRSWAQKQTWTGSAALGPGSYSGGRNLKTCTRRGFAFKKNFFLIVLGIKQGSALSRETPHPPKNNHFEIKLCVSLSAHFTHGRSAKRNFKMFVFVVVDRVLGLFFVRDRYSELCVNTSLG